MLRGGQNTLDPPPSEPRVELVARRAAVIGLVASVVAALAAAATLPADLPQG